MEDLFMLAKGRYAPQAHVGLPEGTFEEEHGRNGFFGRVSHLYHAHPPTSWLRIEGPLRPRALNALALVPGDAEDPRGTPVTFLENEDVALRISRRRAPMPYAYRNGDGDEVWFVHRGGGRLETDYGPLVLEEGDYVVLPRGTTYRYTPTSEDPVVLVIESASEVRLPDRGMLGRNALFDPGVIVTPSPAPSLAAGGEWELVIRRAGAHTSVFYPFDPIDTVGWKGDLTPWKLNVRDFRPVMSHRYHLPPSVHTTMLGHNFVVCTFAPRPLEEDPEAVRVPFYHRNIDFDEVIFYHAGDFFSRDGIAPGMVTYHPVGIHHGPHPKAMAASWTKTATQEYAVMVDTRRPLRLSEEAARVEWGDYWASWGARELAQEASS
ncbi:MAG: homogentisate 1,2-dioxygenase [Candidatus Sericytochromatia bacterium]|nr:homogentisate 1,2-dioxygenase [Candidatus Sericytochromatia bacterium]